MFGGIVIFVAAAVTVTVTKMRLFQILTLQWFLIFVSFLKGMALLVILLILKIMDLTESILNY